MNAVVQRIASLANGLTKAELHVLIELASRVDATTGLDISASSRELADTTGLARASVQSALNSLNKKQLARSTVGSATQSAAHRLVCLDEGDQVAQKSDHVGLAIGPRVAQNFSHSGPTTGPGVAQILSQGSLINKPVVAQNLGEGGPESGPPFDRRSTTCGSPHIESAATRADSIDLKFDKTIDRLQKAKKTDFDETLFELARNQIASHHTKFAREGNRIPHLPDDTITAQFLSIAEWPRLETLLFDLASERKEAGHSHGWYVTVALQRIHGISPGQFREVRMRLKTSPVSSRTPDIKPFPHRRSNPPPVLESMRKGPDMEQIKQQIRNLANARSL